MINLVYQRETIDGSPGLMYATHIEIKEGWGVEVDDTWLKVSKLVLYQHILDDVNYDFTLDFLHVFDDWLQAYIWMPEIVKIQVQDL